MNKNAPPATRFDKRQANAFLFITQRAGLSSVVSPHVKVSDEQAEVRRVYKAVAVEVSGGVVARTGNFCAGIERADKEAEIR